MIIGLPKEQKQDIRLLSMGTFLEYFDLFLYVHMAVLLNELFFPNTQALLAAFAFLPHLFFAHWGLCYLVI